MNYTLKRVLRFLLPMEVRKPVEAYRRRKEAKRLLERRAAGEAEQIWNEALPLEFPFWRDYVRTRGKSCNAEAEFQFRFDPEAPLQEWARELAPPGRSPLRIIDVGAGPATWLGKKWADRKLEIIPVDPLADSYNQLLAEERITAPVPTLLCDAEQLTERFGPSSFDVVFARNSIDHTRDAFRSIAEMFKLVRPNGAMLLVHALNEGEAQIYGGLHQWNFRVRSNELFINDRLREERVLDLSNGSFQSLYCRMEDGLCCTAYRRKP